jgi:hypothetical protein
MEEEENQKGAWGEDRDALVGREVRLDWIKNYKSDT